MIDVDRCRVSRFFPPLPFALPSLYPIILLKGWKAKPPMPSKEFLELLGHGGFVLQGVCLFFV